MFVESQMDTLWIKGILVNSLITLGLLIIYSNYRSVDFEVNFDLP